MLRVEDKRDVILVLSLAANNFLLPLQIVFTIIMPRCLPPNEVKDKCMNSSWDLPLMKTIGPH
jgi:hypothetical protein